MRRRTFLGTAALLPFICKSGSLESERGGKELRADVGGGSFLNASAKRHYRWHKA